MQMYIDITVLVSTRLLHLNKATYSILSMFSVRSWAEAQTLQYYKKVAALNF